MSIFSTIKGWFGMLLNSQAREEFDVKSITSERMTDYIARCGRIYKGSPDWVDEKNHIRTVNFAKSICSEVARLGTLGISVKAGGSARADWVQAQIDKLYFNLRHWLEYACAYGTIILKPNGSDVDAVIPGQFIVTDSANGEITGAVFRNKEYDAINKKWYLRLEYHRFENGLYSISNRCFVGETEHDMHDHVKIEKTPWAGLSEDVYIENVDKPLFGVLRTPGANNIELGSTLGLPIFADALEELRDLDVAYSRNAKEIGDSKRLVLLDSDRLLPGGKLMATAAGQRIIADGMGLPDYIKTIEGTGTDDVYHEINPELNTDERLSGINALLSQIGFKCGFSNGYFVFNEKTGMVTATQVEADDRRTIQLIKDVRDKLEYCLDGLTYALNKFADIYGYAPVGECEPVYGFGDITYNQEEDKARWYSYVTAGRVPFWYYLVKFEGFTEEEAKELEAQAQPKETLFGGVE